MVYHLQRDVAGAAIHGFPLYKEPSNTVALRVPFVKVNLHNDVVMNAYRFLLYRFSQYVYLNDGVVVKNYDPSTGNVDVELPEVPLVDVESGVRQLYERFVSEYLAPRLLKFIREAPVDLILAVFYRRAGEGKQTGLSAVILPVKHVEAYIRELTSGKSFAVQPNIKNTLSSRANRILSSLKQLNLGDNDIVVIDKTGAVVPLTKDDIEKALKSLPEPKTTSSDVKFIKGAKRCCYCGEQKSAFWFPATGKLGLGRYRLPLENKTDFSSKATVCLRCTLVAMYYILDGGERTLIYMLNGLLGALRIEEKYTRGTSVEIAVNIARNIWLETPRDWATALSFNSALGEERITASLEGFDEIVLERLALLSSLFSPGLIRNENVQRALLNYARGSFPSFVTYLSYFLKQSEKGGGMSYVSKEIHRYITPHLYRETEDMRVAYTIAVIAESVVYNLKQAGADDYTIRKFADTLKSGLTTAIAYARPRLEKELKTLRLPDFADKTIVKETLDKYGFRYKESEGALYVEIDSIPVAEIRIRESHGTKALLKAYDILTLLAPEVVTGTTEEEEEKERGEASVAQ